jgi:hypothetical protein
MERCEASTIQGTGCARLAHDDQGKVSALTLALTLAHQLRIEVVVRMLLVMFRLRKIPSIVLKTV